MKLTTHLRKALHHLELAQGHPAASQGLHQLASLCRQQIEVAQVLEDQLGLFEDQARELDARQVVDALAELVTRHAPAMRESTTSREAARRLDGTKLLATGRVRVLAYLWRAGAMGATDDELCSALGLHHNTGRARRHDLYKLGLVHETSSRRVTRQGGRAVVWQVDPSTAAHLDAVLGPLCAHHTAGVNYGPVGVHGG